MSDRTGTDERVCSTQDFASICGGGPRISCSEPPTRATNPRRRGEDEEVESPARFRTRDMCSIIDPPMSLIFLEKKGLIQDEDAPPGCRLEGKRTRSLWPLRRCPSASFQVITNQDKIEDTSPDQVMEVRRSYLHASRSPFSDTTSKVKTSSVYANQYSGLPAREDELLSTASFNDHSEDTDESDNEAASNYYVRNGTVECEEGVPSNITRSHESLHR